MFSFSIVTVQPRPNTSPVAVDDEYWTYPNVPVAMPVLDNDSDPENDPLTVITHTSPSHGTVTNGIALIYTPSLNYQGDDVFQYTVSDGFGGTASANVVIHIIDPSIPLVGGTTAKPVPNPPVASDDAGVAMPNTPVLIDVLANDHDPDTPNGDLVLILNDQPLHGTCEIVGRQIRYTPHAGFAVPHIPWRRS